MAMRQNGPTNSHADLRLFGKNESEVSVTLFRDKHAWCPYCQKIWLWLETKEIPYHVRKVTMFCYGEKERWYKNIVPSGMLPAIEIDGQIVTESDEILYALEDRFGPLHKSMNDPAVIKLRRLERLLFRAWCQWLCYPASSNQEDSYNREQFEQVVHKVEAALQSTEGAWFLDEFSVADVVFVPYVERMSASLFYYKGYLLRDSNLHPGLARWFDALESLETYRGTQSDFHTHCHDLPPQMGGCYENKQDMQLEMKKLVDHGPWDSLPDGLYPEPEDSCEEGLYRVIKHKDNIIAANPCADKQLVDEALRCALTSMMTGEPVQPPTGSDKVLRYIRDRVNVPRDMQLYSARQVRSALEKTAALDGPTQAVCISKRDRYDQDPRIFGR